MADHVYPLNPDIAAELRTEFAHLNSNTQWLLVRLCERAQEPFNRPLVSKHCVAQCELTRAKCQGLCGLTDYATCYQCSAGCGLAAASCQEACPAELVRGHLCASVVAQRDMHPSLFDHGGLQQDYRAHPRHRRGDR